MYSNFDSRRESRDGRDYRDREDRRRPEPYRRDSREASRYGSGTRREEPRRDDRHRQPERQPEPEYRERRRSISPLSKRKRKLDNWDLSPVGYEGMSVAQVKLTGHFPLPGQPPRPGILLINIRQQNFNLHTPQFCSGCGYENKPTCSFSSTFS